VIWLQTTTVFWLVGGTISLRYWVYMGSWCEADRNTYSRATSASAECLWEWDG